MEERFTKAGFARAYVMPALWMFAIPTIGHVFANHVIGTWDAQFVEGVAEAVREDAEITADRRGEILAFYEQTPPSVSCANGPTDALPPEFADSMCGNYRQLGWIGWTSTASLALGALSLVVILSCVAFSFRSRTAQHVSFVTGWNFLRVSSLFQVLLQGFIAVMLSFWVTAFFFERYYVKLIAILGLGALLAAALVIKAIFAKPKNELTVEGELLPRESSPTLWARIATICERLGTPLPDQIIGGIDDNFFVTEHPVRLGDRELTGRTLFISLSLIKRLGRPEADAVLAHEMAHFSGGDTTYSRRLSPLLSQYGNYLEALYGGGWLSRPVFHFMLFYWSLFQLSLGKDSRERELRADRIAAETTSPESVAHALLKVAAYSSYRQRVEQGLFGRDRAHSDLNIAHNVAIGFTEYVQGERLSSDLEGGRFPHPFDSHPSLESRLASIGVMIAPDDRPKVVVASSTDTWFAEIGDAERIEQSLWKAYEDRFKAVHEESLAYRYLPATPEERAHVERFFPAIELVDREGQPALAVDCETIRLLAKWDGPVRWLDVEEIKAEDHVTTKVLVFRVQPRDGKSHKCKLPVKAVSTEQDEVLELIGRYYARAMAAKKQSKATG